MFFCSVNLSRKYCDNCFLLKKEHNPPKLPKIELKCQRKILKRLQNAKGQPNFLPLVTRVNAKNIISSIPTLVLQPFEPVVRMNDLFT